MSAGDLLSPAECNLDLAVTAAIAVADYKIISDALPMPAVFVPIVEIGDIASVSGGMMYHDCWADTTLGGCSCLRLVSKLYYRGAKWEQQA